VANLTVAAFRPRSSLGAAPGLGGDHRNEPLDRPSDSLYRGTIVRGSHVQSSSGGAVDHVFLTGDTTVTVTLTPGGKSIRGPSSSAGSRGSSKVRSRAAHKNDGAATSAAFSAQSHRSHSSFDSETVGFVQRLTVAPSTGALRTEWSTVLDGAPVVVVRGIAVSRSVTTTAGAVVVVTGEFVDVIDGQLAGGGFVAGLDAATGRLLWTSVAAAENAGRPLWFASIVLTPPGDVRGKASGNGNAGANREAAGSNVVVSGRVTGTLYSPQSVDNSGSDAGVRAQWAATSLAGARKVLVTSDGLAGGFVVALSAANGIVQWKQVFSNVLDTAVRSLAVDPTNGRLYAAGVFSVTLNMGPYFSLTSMGFADIFFAELDSGSGSVAWAARSGGSGLDVLYDMMTTPYGLGYVGRFHGRGTFGFRDDGDVLHAPIEGAGVKAFFPQYPRVAPDSPTFTGFVVGTDNEGMGTLNVTWFAAASGAQPLAFTLYVGCVSDTAWAMAGHAWVGDAVTDGPVGNLLPPGVTTAMGEIPPEPCPCLVVPRAIVAAREPTADGGDGLPYEISLQFRGDVLGKSFRVYVTAENSFGESDSSDPLRMRACVRGYIIIRPDDPIAISCEECPANTCVVFFFFLSVFFFFENEKSPCRSLTPF
jgi:hypothetical protein